MLLTVIKPPNNAYAAFLSLKHRLYQKTGLLSSWALAPMIPIAFFDETDVNVTRKELPPLPESGIELSRLEGLGGQYCLSSPGLKKICEQTADLFKDFEGFEPVDQGLHLYDESEVLRSSALKVVELCKELVNELEAPVLNWSSCVLEIYRTDSKPFYSRQWWKRVELETVLSLKFPKVPKY